MGGDIMVKQPLVLTWDNGKTDKNELVAKAGLPSTVATESWKAISEPDKGKLYTAYYGNEIATQVIKNGGEIK